MSTISGSVGRSAAPARPAYGRLDPEGKAAPVADKPMFFYAGVYDHASDAEVDYEAIKALHAADDIGSYDAAVIRKLGPHFGLKLDFSTYRRNQFGAGVFDNNIQIVNARSRLTNFLVGPEWKWHRPARWSRPD